MGEFGRAIELLDKAVAHYGVNAVLLNSTGECYAGLGKNKEALMAFEKSLELSPDQPDVRKKVETLRKKNPL
jgi:Flp pilus assembly protein TadD